MRAIRTAEAPPPAAAYEQAIRSGNLIFVSGQVATNPKAGKIIATTVEAQVTQTLTNIEAILKAAGCDRRDIVRCGVFLADINDFKKMNNAYQDFFGDTVPARTTVQVGLASIRVEIDAIAVRSRRAKQDGNAKKNPSLGAAARFKRQSRIGDS